MYEGFEIVTGSFEELQNILDEGAAKHFVWEDDDKDSEPLLIDITSAHIMLTVYNSLTKEEEKKLFRKFIGYSRAHFGAIHQLCMDAIK